MLTTRRYEYRFREAAYHGERNLAGSVKACHTPVAESKREASWRKSSDTPAMWKVIESSEIQHTR